MAFVVKEFSAENTESDVLQVNGPATLCIEEDPDGSTVDLLTSINGTDWSELYEDGVLTQFTAQTKHRLNCDGPMLLKLKVATGNYGGTPFRAWISASSGQLVS